MEPQLRTWRYANVPELECPIVLLEGRHDELVPSDITAAWLGNLRAPSKTIIWFENSDHMPMIEEPGRTLNALVEKVLPLARER